MKAIEELVLQLEERKQEVIKRIIGLDYPKETAEEMIRVFLEESALAARRRWPTEFSLYTPGETVLDILGESKIQYLSNLVRWETQEAHSENHEETN